MKVILRTVTVVAAASMVVGAAQADELKIGVAIEASSIDPHYHSIPYNYQVSDHMFEPLVWKDKLQQYTPGLAVSWKPIDDKVWEFKLRQGVKFHDGSPFTADDVVLTHERAIVTGSPSPLGRYQRGKMVTKVDDYTVHVTTGAPYPNMPSDMSVVPIIPSELGKGVPTEDFNTGKAAIGTGPYKFVEWVKGDRIVMVPNPDYWGKKETWTKVTLKPIKSDPARIAALLNGDVDMIDYVPTTDLANLRRNPKVALFEAPSYRSIFIHLDSNRDLTPYVFTNDGKPAWPNPLRDWRVRKAISKAINRDAIVERVMEGAAIPGSQIMPDFVFGNAPALKPEPFDPDGAKKLLVQAGYPDGFKVTFHSPNDRYVNDDKIAEAIAQMLTRVGIKTEVTTLPGTVFFPRSQQGDKLGNPEFSIMLFGSGSDTGDGLSSVVQSVGTFKPKENFGSINRGRYSNVRIDKLLEKALVTLDDAERLKLTQEAGTIAIEDVAYIPLHYQKNFWALRKGLVYESRTDERTHAMGVSKAK